MTAVPAAPSKKGVKSLVVPAPPAPSSQEEGAEGQKEEPLFRPLQSSQRTTWNDMHRVNKNSAHYENPIPLLKQMMNKEDQKAKIDPLLEELVNLKKKPKV